MREHQQDKALVLKYFAEMEAARPEDVGDVLRRYAADGYRFTGVHPFNELTGAEAVADAMWQPLSTERGHRSSAARTCSSPARARSTGPAG